MPDTRADTPESNKSVPMDLSNPSREDLLDLYTGPPPDTHSMGSSESQAVRRSYEQRRESVKTLTVMKLPDIQFNTYVRFGLCSRDEDGAKEIGALLANKFNVRFPNGIEDPADEMFDVRVDIVESNHRNVIVGYQNRFLLKVEANLDELLPKTKSDRDRERPVLETSLSKLESVKNWSIELGSRSNNAIRGLKQRLTSIEN